MEYWQPNLLKSVQAPPELNVQTSSLLTLLSRFLQPIVLLTGIRPKSSRGLTAKRTKLTKKKAEMAIRGWAGKAIQR
jgi:hypothetical protein